VLSHGVGEDREDRLNLATWPLRAIFGDLRCFMSRGTGAVNVDLTDAILN
jgi:hypothetical protein